MLTGCHAGLNSKRRIDQYRDHYRALEETSGAGRPRSSAFRRLGIPSPSRLKSELRAFASGKNLAIARWLRQKCSGMRIVQAGYWQHRRFGRARVSTEHKLHFGLIRLGQNVWHFSDRDMAAFQAPFGWRDLGRGKANRRLIETCDNFRPDLLLLGHCDLIANQTLREIRRLLPSLRIAYRNVDALYVEENVAKIKNRVNVVDHIFITTAGEQLKQFESPKTRVSYIPNPADRAIEVLDNSQKDQFDRDLVFCGTGDLANPRYEVVRHVFEHLDRSVRFDTFGLIGRPAVWGLDYDKVLASSKMGLNLNRREGEPLSSSARIAQLMGNGLLTFIDARNGLERFFKGKAVFFEDAQDLERQVVEFNNDDERRREVAGAGRAFYHEHFSSEAVAQFVVEATMEMPWSQEYVWRDV